MRRIDVELGGRGYPIHVGHGILPLLGQQCREQKLGKRVAVVTDADVAPHYLEPAAAGLRDAGYDVLEVTYPGGEAGKNLHSAESIFGRLIEAEMDRSAWVLALGGGVVGDLAGFVAATFMRGISFVQVPTTIVAQVDASSGGKTAVNHSLGKNLIGVFHQPSMVHIDTGVLATLPRRELASGLGEVIKHAVIRDAELFAFLEEHLEDLQALRLDPDALDWVIARNVEIKAAVVEADEREGGIRAILNYGHTIGHAIEAATEYQQYRHGEAVILGMIGAGQIARELGLWSEAERRRQDAVLERVGVPAGVGRVPADLIVERTRADKKRIGGQLRLVLGRRIGEVEIVDGVDRDVVRAAVEYLRERY